jgi:YD repeat-containing protein
MTTAMNLPRKCIGLLLLSALSFLSSRGQTLPPPKVESPNVASFNRFGEIPVNLFTGVPNISIPIHTLKYGNITVPVSLRYHPGSLRVAQHPGWTGLGWDLESNGCITRQVKGYPDEFWGPNIMGNMAYTYYPNPNFSTSGAQVITASDWSSNSKLGGYFSGANTNEVQGDEFSFSFLNYSGKFYWTASGWQVISDDHIKVEFLDPVTPFFDYIQAAGLAGYFSPRWNAGVNDAYAQSRLFKGFILTVPDGTKYHFGGQHGIELSTPYGQPSVQYWSEAWMLTKIVDVFGNEVNFTYRRSYPVCDLRFSLFANSWNCQQTSGGFLGSGNFSGWSTSNVNVNIHSGRLKLPLYLSAISSPNETITFQGSDNGPLASCLRYPDSWLLYREVGNTSTQFDVTRLNYNVGNLQWEQLNRIIIKNNTQAVYRQFQFNYSTSTSQRLTLNSIYEQDKNAGFVGQYTFSYNNPQNLPIYDGNYSDHWGFYNGPANNLAGAWPQQIYAKRQTDPNYVTTGILTQIVYPTGGISELTWEAHDYSQVVSTYRNSLNSATGYAGGSRIKRIRNILENGVVASDKQYVYKRNYTAGANPGNLTSSGVLNGQPVYYMNLQNRPGFYNNINVSVEVASLDPMTQYSYTGSGSHIGYDEVAEVNADGSFTRHYFTSFGADLNNVTHYDTAPINSIGWKLGDDTYYTFSNLQRERGKPIGTFVYTSNNVLVQKSITTYRNDAARFNEFIRHVELSGSYSGCAPYDALILAVANRVYTYNYYPVKKEITTYDQQGGNPIVQTENYTYNSYSLLATKAVANSNGTTNTTIYKYPMDFSWQTPYSNMISAHIISPIVETETNNYNGNVSRSRINYYAPYTGVYVPQEVQLGHGGGGLETRQQFHRYNAKGLLQEQSKPNDMREVYLWGYNNQYLVAKIKGSDYNTVMQYITQAQLDNAASYTDQQMRDALNNIRINLPNAFVTTYTYAPVTGVTSETDARGKTVFYEYDAFQRLKLVKDQDGNIVKTFEYHYK